MSGPVGLIAAREVRSRFQQKGYRIGLLVALVVVAVACVLPSLFKGEDKPSVYDVGLAGAGAWTQRLVDAAHLQGSTVHVHVATAAQARSEVRNGSWDAAVIGRSVLVRKPGDAVVGVLRNAYPLAATLATQQQDVPAALEPLAVSATESAEDGQRQAIATFTVILLFMQLITFSTWVAMGVVEEKASRVVELVLTSVRPLQLLLGKLVGIGALALGQLVAIAVVAYVAATGSGSLHLPASTWTVLPVSFVSFLLAYAFFAGLAAALASTVSRQEEVSGVLLPVTLSTTVCYFASFAVTSSPDSTLARVLSIVPPVSTLAMPARIAHGGVPVLDVALAVVLMVAVAAGIVVVAARIYRASILHSGTRVSLRRAWRGEVTAG